MEVTKSAVQAERLIDTASNLCGHFWVTGIHVIADRQLDFAELSEDMRWVKRAILVANIAMFGLLLLLLDAQGAALIRPGAWEYKDLVAILLTVVSLIVTFIGFIVAVAAIWGFQTLRGIAEQLAVETSKSGSDSYLSSEEFKKQVDAAIAAGMESRARDAVQDALRTSIITSDAAPEHQMRDEEWRD